MWGDGSPTREFLYVDDLAEALIFLMQHYSEESHINVGCGEDLTIMELARLTADAIGYTGKISTNPNKPDGTPQKLLDVSRLTALGWRAKTDLRYGLGETYAWFKEHADR